MQKIVDELPEPVRGGNSVLYLLLYVMSIVLICIVGVLVYLDAVQKGVE